MSKSIGGVHAMGRVMRRGCAALAVGGATAALSGCGVDWRAELNGHTYVGVKASDEQAVPRPERMVLQFQGGGLSATGGCNATSGDYRADGARLQFTDGAMTTQMGCGANPDAWVASLFDAPGARITLTDAGKTLKLSADGKTATFGVAGPSDGPAPLAGPQWRANGFASPRGGTTAIEGGMVQPALRIRGGRATIFTGCNSGTASADVLEHSIRFGDFEPTTERPCRGYVARIDRIVRGTFNGTARFSFGSARSVDITKREGLGLSLNRP